MRNIISKKMTSKTCCIVLAVILLVSLIPLFLMARYAYPMADDFNYGVKTHEAWVSTRSLPEVLKAGMDEAASLYQNWQGTFFACFAMTLQPAIFGVGYYQIAPIILIVSFVLSVTLLCYTVFGRVLHGNLYCALSLAFLLLIYSIQLVPHPSQSFYWYNGAVYYTFSHSLAMVMFSCLLLVYTNKKAVWKTVFVLAASLLAICVGGSNYTTALLSAVLFGVLLLYAAIKKMDKWWLGLFPTILCILSLLASVLAPGNNVRRSLYQDTSIINAMYVSFFQAGQKIIEWVNLPFLVLMAASVPFMIAIARSTKFNFRLPLLFVAGAFCCFAVCFFPTAYTAEGVLYERNVDILFYTFALFAMACLYYCIGWALNKNDALVKLFDIAKDKGVWLVVSLGACMMLYLWPGIGPQNASGLSAARSLVTGEAQAFGELMDRRFAMLNDTALEYVYLPAKHRRPWVLPQEDLNQDSEDWVNVGLARYYHKSEVYIVWEE